jgi:hypothetical protein
MARLIMARFGLSGHGFSRAEENATYSRLQPLRKVFEMAGAINTPAQ